MKKAFTLIEVAIVIVTIGIIMGIIIAGKNMYERILFAKDLTKIYALQNALLVYRQANIDGIPDNLTNNALLMLAGAESFKASSADVNFLISQVNIRYTQASSTANPKSEIFLSQHNKGNNVAAIFLGSNNSPNAASYIFGCLLKINLGSDTTDSEKKATRNGVTYDLINSTTNKVAIVSNLTTMPYYQLPYKISECDDGPFEMLGIHLL